MPFGAVRTAEEKNTIVFHPWDRNIERRFQQRFSELQRKKRSFIGYRTARNQSGVVFFLDFYSKFR